MGFKRDNFYGRDTFDGIPLQRVFRYAPSGSDVWDEYTDLAEAFAACAAGKGNRILRLPAGTFTHPAGAWDHTDVEIIGDIENTYLEMPTGVTWTNPPRVLGISTLLCQSTSPIYNGTGENFDMSFTGAIWVQTGADYPFKIVDPSFLHVARVRMYRYASALMDGAITPFRLENGGQMEISLHDSASISTLPISDDGSFTTYYYFSVFSMMVEWATPDPYLVMAPPGESKIWNMGAYSNLSNMVRMADDTQGDGIDSIAFGYFATGDPAWGVGWWHHPIAALWVQYARGSIMPKGIAGNDLVADGLLSEGLTKGSVTTQADTVRNKIEGLITTAAVANSENGWMTTGKVCVRGVYSRVAITFRISDFSNIRMFVGLTDQATRSNNTSSDNPAGANMIGLQFSTGRGDTRLKFMVKDGATQTVQDISAASGGTPSTSQSYTLEITTMAGSFGDLVMLRLYASSILISERAAWRFPSSQVPANTTQMYIAASLTTLDANAKSIGTVACNVATGLG